MPKIIENKYAEIQDQDNRGIFQAVLRTELSDDASLITTRYVIFIKSDEDKEERYKARYVSGGHLDIMKDYLIHDAQTIKCVSVLIILGVAKIKRLLYKGS